MEDKIFITQQEYDTVCKSLQEAPHINEKLEIVYILKRMTSVNWVKIENLPSPAYEENLKWCDLLLALRADCGAREQVLADEYTSKGFCCYYLGRYDEAAECFRTAINMNSNDCTPYARLAGLYFSGKVGCVNGIPDLPTSLKYAQKGFSLMTEEDKRKNVAFIAIVGDIYCTQESVRNLEEGRRFLDEAVAQGDEDAVRLRKEVFGY